jgi:hypothetical protein
MQAARHAEGQNVESDRGDGLRAPSVSQERGATRESTARLAVAGRQSGVEPPHSKEAAYQGTPKDTS